MNIRTVIPNAASSAPLGTAWLPDADAGVDIDRYGYQETEFLVRGVATEWGRNAHAAPVPRRTGLSYTTRVLVRRPKVAAWCSGVVQVEPHHPNFDSAPSWRVLHPWLMRTGGIWVGVTQDPAAARSLAEDVDPHRYRQLSIPRLGLGYDIVADVASALRAGSPLLPEGLPVRRMYLSGWSMTGSFVRVFLGEGFHRRRRAPDGGPLFDGYVIGISSGGAARAGYPPLSEPAGNRPLGAPERTIRGHDVPVVELLSECESETHEPVLRPDSDGPDDRYRLYQVAGTSHDATGPAGVLTNGVQYRRLGLPTGDGRIAEPRTDARLDHVARAVFAALDRWVSEGTPMPVADRFRFTDRPLPGEAVPDGARPLARDRDGNVLGGIRTPWVEAPLRRYWPHSTPAEGGCRPSPFAPMSAPEQVAAMIGHACPLPPDRLRELYAGARDYLERYRCACARLQRQGLLLSEEAAELCAASVRQLPELLTTQNGATA